MLVFILRLGRLAADSDDGALDGAIGRYCRGRSVVIDIALFNIIGKRSFVLGADITAI